MTTPGEEGLDKEYSDELKLHFGGNAPRLDSLQLIDLGIIDLDDSNEENDEFSAHSNPPRAATKFDAVTSENNQVDTHIKATVIKLVDGYKFPWYCKRYARHIIDKNLLVNESANNKISQVTMNTEKSLKTRQKADLELVNALKLRNKCEIDLKRNTGLIGMKIQRLPLRRNKEANKTAKVNENKKITGSLDNLYVQSLDKALLNLGTFITPVFADTNDSKKIQHSQCTNENVSEYPRSKIMNKNKSKISVEVNLNDSKFKNNTISNITVENDETLDNKLVAHEISRRLTETCNTADEIYESQQLNKPKAFVCKPMPKCKKIYFQRTRLHAENNTNRTDNVVQQNKAIICNFAEVNKPVITLPSKADEGTTTDMDKRQEAIVECDIEEIKDTDMLISAHTEKNITELNINKNKFDIFENDDIKISSPKPSSSTDTDVSKQSFRTMNRYTKNILNKIKANKRKQVESQVKMHASKLLRNDVKPVTTIQHCSNNACKITEPSKHANNNVAEVETKDLNVKNSDNNFFFHDFAKQNDVTNFRTDESTTTIPETNVNNRKNTSTSRDSLTSLEDNNHSDKHRPIRNKLTLNNNMKTVNINSNIKHSNETAEITPPSAIKSNNKKDNPITKTDILVGKRKSSGQRKQVLKATPPEITGNVEDYLKLNFNKNSMNPVQLPTTSQSENDLTEQFEPNAEKHNRAQIPTIYTPNIQKFPIMPTLPKFEKRDESNPVNVYNSLQSHTLYRPQTENIQAQTQHHGSSTSRYRAPKLQINQPQLPFYQQHQPLLQFFPPAPYFGGIFPPIATAKQICNLRLDNPYGPYSFPPPFLPPTRPQPIPRQSQETPGLPYTSQVIYDSTIGRNNEGIITKINVTTKTAHITPKLSEKPNTNDDESKIGNDTIDSSLIYDKAPIRFPDSPKLVTTTSEMRQELDSSVERLSSPIDYFSSEPESHMPSPIKISKRAPEIYKEADNDKATSSCIQSKYAENDLRKRFLPLIEPKNITSGKQNDELASSNAATEELAIRIDKLKHTNAGTTLPNHESKSMNHERKKKNFNNNVLDSIRSLSNMANDSAVSNIPLPLDKNYCESKKTLLRNTATINEIPQKYNEKSANLKRNLNIKDSHNNSPKDTYKAGPLSKKLKVDDSRASVYKSSTLEERKRALYSPPILPIPTFEKVLSETRSFDDSEVRNNATRSFDATATAKSFHHVSGGENSQFEKNHKHVSRRISLDEYKKRTANERRKDEERKAVTNNHKEIAVEENIIEIPRRVLNVDSDLGYDSDDTVKL